MKPVYLIAGTDAAKIEAARSRLRARAESEGGAAALETFSAPDGRAAPDVAPFLGALAASSLLPSRRYLLVEGVERWRPADQATVADALGSIAEDTTIVLVARGKPPAILVSAVEAAGGEVHSYAAPRPRDLPRHLISEAAGGGFRLESAAARLLVERMGDNPLRLSHELDRLALWAGQGGNVGLGDLEGILADSSETAMWALSDALLDRDAERAVAIGERLLAQGESVTPLVYALASRLRKASQALAALAAGRPSEEIARDLAMHPYAAKQLLGRLKGVREDELREATTAIADLEVWCRGGADYGEDLALLLALRRAAGAGPDELARSAAGGVT